MAADRRAVGGGAKRVQIQTAGDVLEREMGRPLDQRHVPQLAVAAAVLMLLEERARCCRPDAVEHLGADPAAQPVGARRDANGLIASRQVHIPAESADDADKARSVGPLVVVVRTVGTIVDAVDELAFAGTVKGAAEVGDIGAVPDAPALVRIPFAHGAGAQPVGGLMHRHPVVALATEPYLAEIAGLGGRNPGVKSAPTSNP